MVKLLLQLLKVAELNKHQFHLKHLRSNHLLINVEFRKQTQQLQGHELLHQVHLLKLYRAHL